jgi:low affinity Fe/Cu permease
MAKQINKSESIFEKIAVFLAKFTGSTTAFIIAFGIVIVWAIAGPVFGYSETWQLIINTGTTIITFLMVFLIQRLQNKDSLAIQLKLNELIASTEGASNRLVDVEDISEEELEVLKKHYRKLARLFEQEKNIKESHSIEEAEKRHKKTYHK